MLELLSGKQGGPLSIMQSTRRAPSLATGTSDRPTTSLQTIDIQSRVGLLTSVGFRPC